MNLSLSLAWILWTSVLCFSVSVPLVALIRIVLYRCGCHPWILIPWPLTQHFSLVRVGTRTRHRYIESPTTQWPNKTWLWVTVEHCLRLSRWVSISFELNTITHLLCLVRNFHELLFFTFQLLIFLSQTLHLFKHGQPIDHTWFCQISASHILYHVTLIRRWHLTEITHRWVRPLVWIVILVQANLHALNWKVHSFVLLSDIALIDLWHGVFFLKLYFTWVSTL